ncbi:hypothetical protein B0H19DRAFT_1205591 [Mycena capillaripes]|nr:hypothetical protein B0H19DRAFT_1205591 [Mycena capillaripes]
MNDRFLTIDNLGRNSYLGQLYDAKTSTLLPSFSLYKSDDIKPRKADAKNVKIEVHKIRSFSDRANSLDVSAQLSVSILCGAISVSGSGSYLKSKQDTSESNTVAIVAQYRTTSHSFDPNELDGKIVMSASLLARTRATHVVTSVTYGANVVGTLTQKSTNTADTKEIKGNFSREMFKRLKSLFSAEGKAEFTSEEKEEIKAYNLDVKLAADINLGDREVPTDPASMFDLVKKSASLVGEGIPCEVQLTPLTILMSDIPTYRELAEADLINISTVYGRILKFENSRGWLHDVVSARAELFPTFAERICTNTVDVIVQQARDELRAYLTKYRSATSDAEQERVEKPGDFSNKIKAQFQAELAKCEADKQEWRQCQDLLSAAEYHGFPLIGVSALSGKMNRVDKGMLAAVLVPGNVNWDALKNLYGDIGVDIRQWCFSIDKDPEGQEDETAPVADYVSIYADPARDATLESLDDRAGTLKNALKVARDTRRAVFLTYGRSRSHLGGFVWHALNKEGWGVLINPVQKWRYIGDVHLGKPHGRGVMTYVNQTKYAGDFVYGQRDGVGKILDAEGKEVAGQCGVFIKNVLEPQGVMVEVTYSSVALNKFAAVCTHVHRIATVMDWEERQKFKLVLDDGKAQVDVVGSMVDPSEPPSVEYSFWPLDGPAPKATARVR